MKPMKAMKAMKTVEKKSKDHNAAKPMKEMKAMKTVKKDGEEVYLLFLLRKQQNEHTHTLLEATKRKSGARKEGAVHKSTRYPKGVERRPLLRKSTFSDECLKTLQRFHFEPRNQGFLPDGRWVIETRGNGSAVHFTQFLMSFD